MTPPAVVVDEAARIVATLAEAVLRAAETSQAFAHANEGLVRCLKNSDMRRAVLEELLTACDRGELSPEAYKRILLTIAKLLKGSIGLVTEVQRVIGEGRE